MFDRYQTVQCLQRLVIDDGAYLKASEEACDLGVLLALGENGFQIVQAADYPI